MSWTTESGDPAGGIRELSPLRVGADGVDKCGARAGGTDALWPVTRDERGESCNVRGGEDVPDPSCVSEHSESGDEVGILRRAFLDRVRLADGLRVAAEFFFFVFLEAFLPPDPVFLFFARGRGDSSIESSEEISSLWSDWLQTYPPLPSSSDDDNEDVEMSSPYSCGLAGSDDMFHVAETHECERQLRGGERPRCATARGGR